MRQICAPLRHFQINLFTYLRKYRDGSQINLSTNPGWIEDYYNLELYKTSSYESKPNEYQTGIALWPTDSRLKVFDHGREYYDSVYGFTITKKQKDSCEFFFFSLAKNNFQQINVCLNNLDLFEQFILYFKERAEDIIKSCENNKIILPCEFNANLTINNGNIREKFSREIKGNAMASLLSEHEPLTRREQECLNLLLIKPTVVEIAKELHISKRTAETHLARIKSKLECDSKQQLLVKLTQAAGRYAYESH